MNIKEVAVSRLKEYENNPRNNDLAVEKVKYSIQRFGMLFPIVIDINYVIVAGHTRVRACRELGIQTVPAIIADDLNEEQINLFRLVDNKTSEYSDWDFERLKSELATVDLTLEKNQILLDRFELSAEVFDIEPEQAEIKIPAFNFLDSDTVKEKKPAVRTVPGESEMENAGFATVGAGHKESPETVAESSALLNGGDCEAESVVFSAGQEHEAEVLAPQSSQNRGVIPVKNLSTSAETPDAATTDAGTEKASKAVLPYFQFRFGEVSFFISQVELDHLNERYSEYIDSGAVLEESFVNYLLKGVGKL